MSGVVANFPDTDLIDTLSWMIAMNYEWIL